MSTTTEDSESGNSPAGDKTFRSPALRSALSVAGVAGGAAKIVWGGVTGDYGLAAGGLAECANIILDRACEEVRQETGREPRPEKLGLEAGATLARNLIGSDAALQKVWWKVLKNAISGTGNGPFLRHEDMAAIKRLNAPEAVLLVALGPSGTNGLVGEWRKTTVGSAALHVSQINTSATQVATLLPLWWINERARGNFDVDLTISEEDYLYAIECRSQHPGQPLGSGSEPPLWSVERWSDSEQWVENLRTNQSVSRVLNGIPTTTFRHMLGIHLTPFGRRLYDFVRDLPVPDSAG